MTLHYTPRFLFDGHELLENRVVKVDDGKVIDILVVNDLSENIQAIKLDGILSPGFVDLQVNGGGGVLFNDEPDLLGLKKILTAHQQYGTEYILPTIITDDINVMVRAADAVCMARQSNLEGIIGIHFEGPHISAPKKGVHPDKFIRPLSQQEKALYARSDIGIKLVTIAPEVLSEKDLEFLIENNCIVSIGHTNASYSTHCSALELGASGFTHLFNAMSPLTGREPGAVGAALNNEGAYAGIILDGYHVDYASAKLAWKIKNNSMSFSESSKLGRLYLVSDAMSSIGSQIDSFQLFDQTVLVQDGRLTNEAGTLAGAHLNLLTAVQNAHQHLDISIKESLKMATSYPTEYIDQNATIGGIKIGSRANFILLDLDLNLIERITN
ncbi:N-acetylglucosamine-6-phosphate deacetylase [Psychrosphaera aestuarii]|uniref:N-acetylglucosamine-6-phosphate deacetylase n=1 Tax=Psychrosphaera aestuarii TaxID=1266052 RepID=UPI001B3389C7|nr:N-acetylglucosamine-6-phosphate deacetylase [Psychrosphaera aestuarii]